MKNQIFKSIGLEVPEIYLPKKGVDLNKFSVIACDQYSAEPNYWEKVKEHVGDSVSTLNMILPEAYLGKEVSYDGINAKMQEYLDNGDLVSIGKGLVFLKRETSSGIRRGLVCALDLEEYGHLIRPTERTVKERLPERVKIRKNAPLELPHVMILINDTKDEVNALLEKHTSNLSPLYDFKLFPKNDGLKGWLINDEKFLNELVKKLESLKYDDFIFAMGDGNHSFAAARQHWDNIKVNLSEEERENHPARFALAEIVNLFDPALEFEPIHRLVMNCDKEDVKKYLGITDTFTPDLQNLQPKLDEYLEKHKEVELEYIHGKENCERLAKERNGLSITWDVFEKDSLFKDVKEHGELCRKSFSMGQADDKRFYLECRKIK